MYYPPHAKPAIQPDRINLNDKANTYAWTVVLDVSQEQLRRAIAAVGDTAGNVKNYLRGHPQRHSSFDQSSFG
ncbi:DUF3606 domain-containing protein [Polaromonas sp. YR568]|uniref:DUF3606 domain-containing protein n=1 Tax=Polaromonas sp. YR568 TaxID=1855301 RepID=UPI00398BCAA4